MTGMQQGWNHLFPLHENLNNSSIDLHCTSATLRENQFWVYLIEIMQEVGDDLNICMLNILPENNNLPKFEAMRLVEVET